MTKPEIAKLLRVARTIWPDLPAGEDTITAWQWALGDLSYELVQHALQAHMRTSPFPPKPADLRKVLAEDAVGPLTWQQAWDEVWQVAQRHGRTMAGFAGWSSPEVAEAVKHVGFVNVCDTDADRIPAIRAQFRDFVNAKRDRQIRAYQTGSEPIPAYVAPGNVVPITSKTG